MTKATELALLDATLQNLLKSYGDRDTTLDTSKLTAAIRKLKKKRKAKKKNA